MELNEAIDHIQQLINRSEAYGRLKEVLIKVQSADTDVAALAQQKDTLLKDIEVLQSQRSSVLEANAKADADIKAYREAGIDTANAEVENVRAELPSLYKKVSSLNATILLLKGDATKQEEENHNTVSLYAAKIASLQKQQDALQMLVDGLRSKLKEL